VFGNPEQPPLN